MSRAGASTALAEALQLAARGWPVFPCDGKRPFTAHGLHDASTDRQEIDRWFTRVWPAANLGLRTGIESGLLVLDVDGEPGADTLAALEAEHGELPRTVECLTGGGGRHLYFEHPGVPVRNSAGKLGEGLDTRGDGGYVVTPPSLHESGQSYEWTADQAPGDLELAKPPGWLLRALADTPSRNGNTPAGGERIAEGARNATLTSLAGTMRKHGLSAPEIHAALQVANRTRCETPLPDSEIETIAASVGRYESDAPPKNYEFATLGEFSKHAFPDAEPLLGEHGSTLLAVGSLFLVYGSDGAGKSTFTIDAAAHLAAGKDWLGVPVPRPARCLLIENEGPAGLFQGKLAAKIEGWDGPDFAENIHVYSSPWGEISFADEHARTALSNYCDEHRIDVVMANPTLGLGVGPSGRPDETQQFVDWLKECGLGSSRAFWIIHHENKAGQISGDWGRHPDTKAQLTADGTAQRTKLLWEKVRWATLAPEDRAVMLEWELETQGYTVTPLDTVGASDDLLVQRLIDYLDSHPASATKHVCEAIAGTDSRLVKLLKERPEFDCADGPHNAKLWMHTDRSAA